MIDEPEVSLHPELLSLLAELMREASDRTQLIVATYSDRLIRFLKPEEVVVMDSAEDGLTVATAADQLDLDKWLANYTLDEVAHGPHGRASMKITIFVEGETEQAFKPNLREFLRQHLSNNMPNLDFFPYHGRIPKGDELKTKVETSLTGGRPSDHVIALTDVYTGTADFSSANDAKKKMREWVGQEPRSLRMWRCTISKPGCCLIGRIFSD